MTLDEFQAELATTGRAGLVSYFAAHFRPLIEDAEWEPPEVAEKDEREKARHEAQAPMREMQRTGQTVQAAQTEALQQLTGTAPGAPEGADAGTPTPQSTATQSGNGKKAKKGAQAPGAPEGAQSATAGPATAGDATKPEAANPNPQQK